MAYEVGTAAVEAMPGDLQFLAVALVQETDGRWIADIPELPGVTAYGADRDEAIAAVGKLAREVIADRIEVAAMTQAWILAGEVGAEPAVQAPEVVVDFIGEGNLVTEEEKPAAAPTTEAREYADVELYREECRAEAAQLESAELTFAEVIQRVIDARATEVEKLQLSGRPVSGEELRNAQREDRRRARLKERGY